MEPAVARILDANFNRAREALRVMEDYARFVLDDPGGCAAVKVCRHELAVCHAGLGGDALLAARDTPGDVGTTISTAAESVRPTAASVFTAAAKRLPEALRTIEEYAKTIDTDTASRVEALRYRAYDLEQRLACRGDRAGRLARAGLYVIVTASMGLRDWRDVIRDAIAGGAGIIQLREKGLEDGDLLARARDAAAICRDAGALFIVNDRPDIARLADADGVHLGQTDMPPADARRIVGPDRLIGLSTHNPDQLRTAIAAAPDYIAVGPMFASSTKPQDHVPGVDLLKLAVRETRIPIVPIGGIDAGRADILRAAGATCVCVCSAVIAAGDVKSAAAAFGMT